MNTRYYIAYGSNLNVRQMQWRCPDARIVGTAVLTDWRLLFRGSKTGAYLTIGKEPGGSVPVAVWAVSEADEAALDRYEGYPVFYYKTELPVEIKGIRTGRLTRHKAFVYIMHEDRPEGLPTGAYVRTCAEGYRDFGFDLKVLSDAIWNTREDRHENR